jgi:hypothetical protein
VTTAGTLPFGFRPGRPFGLAAVSVPLPPGAPGAPLSSELLSINTDLRIWWLTPLQTVALSLQDLKHLFEEARSVVPPRYTCTVQSFDRKRDRSNGCTIER